MADTRVTPTEITRKFLSVFHSNCVFAKNLNSEYDKFGQQVGYDGQKIGPTLNIRKPIQTNVRTGWGMSQQDVTESYVALTVDTVRGIDLKFTDADLGLSIDDFVPRYIESPAKKLAAIVDQVVATYMAKYINNAVAASSLAIPTTIDTYLAANQLLKESLVPFSDGINVVVDPVSERKIVSGLAGQYNPQGNISEMYEKGQMAKAAGLDWYMSQVLPTLTTGTATKNGGSLVVGTFSTSARTTLPFSGSNSSSATWAAGTTFTIAGLYDVNFETKGVYNRLKVFTVTTAYTNASATTGSLTISPGINFDTSSPDQNCYIAAGSIDGVAIVLCALEPNNASSQVEYSASTSYGQNILFHKDAFAFASVPLMQPKGLDMASTVTVDNLSFRFLRGYDIVNARLLSRMDIFFGIAALRPEWAAKVIHI
jgi:hypothetical protein